MVLSPEMFALDDLMKEVVEAVEPMATSKKLDLRRDCPKGVRVYADRMKLKQVLLNLMSNAVKFTMSGSVVMSARRGGDSGDIELRVEDTGIGIAAKDIPLLFQEFKQLDGSNTRIYKGTGLGLAISKKLVALMQGTICVESTPKKGSAFIVQRAHR